MDHAWTKNLLRFLPAQEADMLIQSMNLTILRSPCGVVTPSREFLSFQSDMDVSGQSVRSLASYDKAEKRVKKKKLVSIFGTGFEHARYAASARFWWFHVIFLVIVNLVVRKCFMFWAPMFWDMLLFWAVYAFPVIIILVIVWRVCITTQTECPLITKRHFDDTLWNCPP
jgi:hypothetical protein